jgi:nitroreductase
MDLEKGKKILETIAKRRSVYPKHYSGEKIDKAAIELMLEAANWAPTHKYTEPWRFKVYEGNSLFSLNAFMRDNYINGRPVDEVEQRKLNKYKDIPEKTSHIIAIILNRDEDERIPEIEEISSVACAVQNMYLTATEMGLACYWSTGNGTYSQAVCERIGLKNKQRLMGFFFVGVPALKLPEGFRKPWQDKVEWI